MSSVYIHFRFREGPDPRKRGWRESVRTAVVVIVHRQQALILLRGSDAPWCPNLWNLPGGTVDEHETPDEAATRECEEETGVRPVSLLRLCEIDMGDNGLLFAYTYTADHLQEMVVRTCDESAGHAWVSVADLDRYTFVPHVLGLIRAALTTR